MVKIYEVLMLVFAITIIGVLVIGMIVFAIGEWALKKLSRALDKKINSVFDF